MAMRALSFLQSLDAMSLIVLFWYTTLLEIPRYAIGTLIVATTRMWRRAKPPIKTNLAVSVVLAGHNEAKSLRACVEAVAEQTIIAELGGIEVIVVDDGSTDRMSEVARQLRGEGKVDEVLRLKQRGGKSAAVNLGISAAPAMSL